MDRDAGRVVSFAGPISGEHVNVVTALGEHPGIVIADVPSTTIIWRKRGAHMSDAHQSPAPESRATSPTDGRIVNGNVRGKQTDQRKTDGGHRRQEWHKDGLGGVTHESRANLGNGRSWLETAQDCAIGERSRRLGSRDASATRHRHFRTSRRLRTASPTDGANRASRPIPRSASLQRKVPAAAKPLN